MEIVEEKIFTATDAENFAGNHITIPYGYTAIDNEAFYERDDIISVDIPDSVTTIGYQAFGNCENLSEIILPDSIEISAPSAERKQPEILVFAIIIRKSRSA